jgi:hypothetical protein
MATNDSLPKVSDILGIGIQRMADFWWVVVDGKPSYPCDTKKEAIEIANYLCGVDYEVR